MFLELERIAKSIRSYESELIHGLLQTEDYARAIHDVDPLITEEQANQAVELRIKRQEMYWEDPRQLRDVCLIMHETAVMRPVLSEDGMAQQHQRMRDTAQMPGVEILVLPTSIGAHASMKGPYQIMESSLSEIPDTVYLESVDGCRYEESANCLDTYRTTFEQSRSMAIPIEEFLNEITLAQVKPQRIAG